MSWSGVPLRAALQRHGLIEVSYLLVSARTLAKIVPHRDAVSEMRSALLERKVV